MANSYSIPVIDLFAGPGGLGEGFASVRTNSGIPAFKICLSIEKDRDAHSTLMLRSFFRQFDNESLPDEYYAHIRGEIGRDELFSTFPIEARKASQEAWLAELGGKHTPSSEVDLRIRQALANNDRWLLIGGPPCQAYSMAGRSRNKGIKGYLAEDDIRHHLYEEYLRIIALHWPSVFIMENVKGLLSSKVKGAFIFQKIVSDLRSPSQAVGSGKCPEKPKSYKYNLFALSEEKRRLFDDHVPADFLLRFEHYGIPQARHRVIILGVREDIAEKVSIKTLVNETSVSAIAVLAGLPPLRSGLSRERDNSSLWIRRLRSGLKRRWLTGAKKAAGIEVQKLITDTLNQLSVPACGRGMEFIHCSATVDFRKDWFLDERIMGVCHHETRAHILNDLFRYLYASCYTQVHGKSPSLRDFPKDLLPRHKNVDIALSGGNFGDRFRVQVSGRAATTITSHISKDGHYYIHYDPKQCRSLTVREAARLQTFPDNYLFSGGRTSQYTQVGNAVPPLMAKKIAEEVVLDIFEQLNTKK